MVCSTQDMFIFIYTAGYLFSIMSKCSHWGSMIEHKKESRVNQLVHIFVVEQSSETGGF